MVLSADATCRDCLRAKWMRSELVKVSLEKWVCTLCCMYSAHGSRRESQGPFNTNRKIEIEIDLPTGGAC